MPTGLTKDRCIKAVSVKPSLQGRAAAHHANSDLVVFDEKTGQYVDGERLSEYALGQGRRDRSARRLPDAAGQLAGRWDVHYYPIGEELKDDVIEMGIWLYPEDHQAKYKQDLKLYSLLMKGGELEIPPHGTGDDAGVPLVQDPGADRQLPAARPLPPGRQDARDLLSRRRASSRW